MTTTPEIRLGIDPTPTVPNGCRIQLQYNRPADKLITLFDHRPSRVIRLDDYVPPGLRVLLGSRDSPLSTEVVAMGEGGYIAQCCSATHTPTASVLINRWAPTPPEGERVWTEHGEHISKGGGGIDYAGLWEMDLLSLDLLPWSPVLAPTEPNTRTWVNQIITYSASSEPLIGILGWYSTPTEAEIAEDKNKIDQAKDRPAP